MAKEYIEASEFTYLGGLGTFPQVPSWTPCKVDPENFNCDECEIGEYPCRLRLDSTLRQYLAARARRNQSILPSVDGKEAAIERQLFTFLQFHGVSITPSLVLLYLDTELTRDVSEVEIHSILKRSTLFVETSPGVFGIATRRDPVESALGALVPSTGSLLEDLLHKSVPLQRDQQSFLFKKLAGLKFVIAHQKRTAEVALALVDELSEWAKHHRGWSHLDIYRFAVSPETVPRVAEGRDTAEFDALVKNTHTLLSAVSAIEWMRSTQDEDYIVQHLNLREELTLANLRLVSTQAFKWSRVRSLTFGDLFQDGFFGLARGVDRFDPFRGIQFSTYATTWIMQRITRAIADKERIVRIPVHMLERVKQLERALVECHERFGREPRVAELASQLKWNSFDVVSLLKYRKETLSLEYLLRDSLSCIARDIVSHNDPADVLEERLCAISAENEIRSGMKLLTDRQVMVLELRFGIGGQSSHTLEQVGKLLGVTRERVRQIEKRAKDKLRRHLHQRRTEARGLATD